MSGAQKPGLCVWNAFGEYSCQSRAAGSVTEFFAPETVAEKFDDQSKGGFLSKLLKERFTEKNEEPVAKEGFCGCQASAGNF